MEIGDEMNNWKKIMMCSVASTIATVTISAPITAGTAAAQTNKPVTIMAISDFHGALDTRAYGDIPKSGGVTKLTCEFKKVKDSNSQTQFVTAGDITSYWNNQLSANQGDMPSFKLFNNMGMTAMAAGNHEFDGTNHWSKDAAAKVGLKRIKNVMDGANFPVLSANGTNIHADLAKEGNVPNQPGVFIKNVDGKKVAYVGISVKDTGAPDLVKGIGIDNIKAMKAPIDTANKIANVLKDGNPNNGEADIVVGLLHMGIQTNAKEKSSTGYIHVRDTSEKFDVVVGGHTHKYVNYVRTNKDGSQTGFYQGNAVAMNMGKIDVSTRNGKNYVTIKDIDLLRSNCNTPAYGAKNIVKQAQEFQKHRAWSKWPKPRANKIMTMSGYNSEYNKWKNHYWLFRLNII